MKGKKILIVGGSSGIGLALAQKAKEKQARVIIASKNAKEKEHQLRKKHSLEGCSFFSLDITSENDIEQTINEIDNIDHIVSTVKAPLANITDPFTELAAPDVRQAFEVKLWGQYNLAKICCKKISAGGSITFSSGTLATHPHPNYSTLSIINGAVNSLCRVLALELAPVRVNAVSPGFITLQKMEEKIPLGLAKYEQLANSYMFLMEDKYTTGTNIVTDGGATLV